MAAGHTVAVLPSSCARGAWATRLDRAEWGSHGAGVEQRPSSSREADARLVIAGQALETTDPSGCAPGG